MPTDDEVGRPPETIPQEVMRAFLDQLTLDNVSTEVIERLRRVLVISPDLSEVAIRQALFAPSERL